MNKLYYNLPLLAVRSIRLLTILPDDALAQIQCTLQVAEFSHTLSYEALSYVWGTQDSPTRISCNGYPTDVGPNLAAALQKIRLVDKPRVLWIDALCIDQSNLKERSNQVAFMHEIYQKAGGVLMWLGTDVDGSVEPALGLIDKAAKFAREEAVSPRPRPEEIKGEGPSLENNASRGFPPPQDPSWDALVRLFQRPYFERIWILQEVYQAVSVMILIGDHRREWDDFGVAAHWFAHKSYAAMIPGFVCLVRVFSLWGFTLVKALGEPPGPLVDLLRSLPQLVKATDPRDKVYALLGLSNDILGPEKPTALYPDYEKAFIDVYIDTIRYLLRNPRPGHNQKLGFLSVGYTTTTLERSAHQWLPSWIPRWDTEHFTWHFSGIVEAQIFRASKAKEVCFGFNDLRYSLFLKGIHIDNIKSVDQSLWGLPGPANRTSLWKKVKSLWISTILPLENSRLYFNREYLSLAFAQALAVCADINLSGLRHRFNASDFTTYCVSQLEAETKDMLEEEKIQHLASFPLPIPTASIQGDGELFAKSICTTKPFFTTYYGFIGRCHESVRASDTLCIFYGAITPHILRPRPDHHILIGDCFIPGLMFGEGIREGVVDGWFELR